MEVQEPDAAAALHQPVGGHGRVDAARQQAQHRPAHAGRQTARTGMPVERVVERLARARISMRTTSSGVSEGRPASPRAALIRPPHLTLDFGRCECVRLVGTAGGHPEAARLAAVQIGDDGACQLVDIAADAPRPGEVGDAEHPAQALADGIPRGVRTGGHLDAAHDGPHAGAFEVAQRGAQVRHEPLDEPGAVLPLEGDLLIVDDDRFHLPLLIA